MYDLVVLGGGSGGLHVASLAARVGAKVALIEKKHAGDASASHAAVQSKALVDASRLAHIMRNASAYGIRAGNPQVDFPAIMARVRAVDAKIASADSGGSVSTQGIDVYHGKAAFEAYDSVLLDGATRINGQRFVIATGSRPRVPHVPGLADVGHVDPVSVWSLNALPASLIVLGGSSTAVEFAQAFSRLGSKVAIVTDAERLLPAEDAEVSERLTALLRAEGIGIVTGVEVTKVSTRDGEKVCTYRATAGGNPGEVSGTELLIAGRRLANVDGLNLDAVGIHVDSAHGIEVDDYLQTRSSRIFAIGDVLLRHEVAHAAEREAEVAFHNAVLRLPKKADYRALPWATFVDPEIATVGLSEAAARAQHDEIRVFRANFADLDRARIDGVSEGFAKVVATPSGKILGATVMGEQASLILQEFVLAMENGLSLADIASAAHTYPTYAGLARAIAGQYVAARFQGSFLQAALRWFLGYTPRGEAVPESEDTAVAPPAEHAPAHTH
jgi:pyruvate/2-oxoglutarate dehydrogenase complex dihydrolipoamide dehydrogenase (E3) component